MVSKVSIVLIVSIVCLSSLYTAYADEYTALGIRHADNPVVCIFEPDPEHTDNVEGVVNAAYTAVSL